MYRIMTPVWKAEPVISQRPFVHPFYKNMFRKLYGLDEDQAEAYTGADGAAAYSCDFVAHLVREVWERHKNDAVWFYDIRINEEMGHAAPEYAIMKRAGIRNISPINIRGMGSMALLMGLQLTGLDTSEGNCAIVLLAELEHAFSAGKENTACAFALYPCDKIDDSKGIWITDYRMYLTADEAVAAVKNFKGRIIFHKERLGDTLVSDDCIICGGYGLTEPLICVCNAMENVESADIMTVHRSGSKYGVVCYRVQGGSKG